MSAVDGFGTDDDVSGRGAIDDVRVHAIEAHVEMLRDARLDLCVGQPGVETEFESVNPVKQNCSQVERTTRRAPRVSR